MPSLLLPQSQAQRPHVAFFPPVIWRHGERGKRQGRQRKRWKDIREWTGLELAKSQRAVENREKWRKLVVKSSVVPQQPLRLGIDDDVESEKKPTNAHLDFKMNDLIENFLSEFRLMLSLLHQLYQGWNCRARQNYTTGSFAHRHFLVLNLNASQLSNLFYLNA